MGDRHQIVVFGLGELAQIAHFYFNHDTSRYRVSEKNLISGSIKNIFPKNTYDIPLKL